MTPTPRALQAIVFDFDGVLADTEPLHLRAFREVLHRRDLSLSDEEYEAHYLGFDDRGVFRQIGSDRRLAWSEADIDALVAEKAVVFEGLARSGDILFPGVADRLRAWSAVVPLAVASGALRAELEMILSAAGVRDCVMEIVAAGETAAGKPAPDPYRRALELLAARLPREDGSLDPARTVAVEDSLWGIDSARGAGMKVVAIETSYTADRLNGCDLVLPRFEALTLDALEQLAARPR